MVVPPLTYWPYDALRVVTSPLTYWPYDALHVVTSPLTYWPYDALHVVTSPLTYWPYDALHVVLAAYQVWTSLVIWWATWACDPSWPSTFCCRVFVCCGALCVYHVLVHISCLSIVPLWLWPSQNWSLSGNVPVNFGLHRTFSSWAWIRWGTEGQTDRRMQCIIYLLLRHKAAKHNLPINQSVSKKQYNYAI